MGGKPEQYHDLAGLPFGKLLAEVCLDTAMNASSKWDCVCKCGRRATPTARCLVKGRAKTCGYCKSSGAPPGYRTHGLSRHPLYGTWSLMRHRCYNPKNQDYYNYGQRGIVVCERWHQLENFIEDMHPSYQKGLTLDRYPDKDGPYCPENCRWATAKEQSNNSNHNRTIETPAGAMTIAQAAEYFNLDQETLRRRLVRGTKDPFLSGDARSRRTDYAKPKPRRI